MINLSHLEPEKFSHSFPLVACGFYYNLKPFIGHQKETFVEENDSIASFLI